MDDLQKQQEQNSAQEPVFDFLSYIGSLAFQAMIFLGAIENPVTKKIDKNVNQAKFLIDTLILLREKTKGNLSEQESNMLNTSICELQMQYVDIDKKDKDKSVG